MKVCLVTLALVAGASYTVTKAGTFTCICGIHPFVPPKTIRVVA